MSTRPRFMHVLTLGLAAMGFLASSSMLAQARVDILGGAPAGSSIRRTSRGQRVQITRGGGHSLPIKKHASISRPAKHTSRAKPRKRARCKVKRRSHR